jgi:hypothetical protein
MLLILQNKQVLFIKNQRHQRHLRAINKLKNYV